VWWPDIEVERMPLAVLAAAAPTAAERAAARERGTSVHAVAAERLGPLLDALDRPAVDLAVDPALLVDVPGVLDLTAAQPEPASSPTDQPLRKEAPTALRSAIEGFAAGPGRTVHALLWADADAAALAHSGRGDLIERVAAARDEALAQSGLDAGTGLAWPAGERPDGETLGALAGGRPAGPRDRPPVRAGRGRRRRPRASRRPPRPPPHRAAWLHRRPRAARRAADCAGPGPVARAHRAGGDARPPGARAGTGEPAGQRRRGRGDRRHRAEPGVGGARPHHRLRRCPRRAGQARRPGPCLAARADLLRVAAAARHPGRARHGR